MFKNNVPFVSIHQNLPKLNFYSAENMYFMLWIPNQDFTNAHNLGTEGYSKN